MALKTKNAERRVITTSSLKEKKEPEKGVNPLRPQSFGSYIGQTKVKEQVSVSVRSAIKRGKPASHITGVPLEEDELKDLARSLKQKCGVGGSVKDFNIEIQGDKRNILKAELEMRGYTVKLAGG